MLIACIMCALWLAFVIAFLIRAFTPFHFLRILYWFVILLPMTVIFILILLTSLLAANYFPHG